jgi:hypothetical protein
MTDQALRAFAERIASRPLSTEDTTATWCPPDWETIIEWWDDAVSEARQLTGKQYRNPA